MAKTERVHDPRFAQVLGMLGIAMRTEVSPAMADVYERLLEPYPIESIEAAATEYARRGTFFPRPAELIEIIERDLPKPLTVTERAEIAWQQVLGAIARIGPYRPLVLDDPVAVMCVRVLGGWPKLCGSTDDQLVWIRKEFLTSYEIYADRPADMLPASLPGVVELQRARLGHKRGQEVRRVDA